MVHCHPTDPVPGRYTVTQQTQYQDGTLSATRPSTGTVHCHPTDPVPGRYTTTQQTQYRDGTLSPYRPSTGTVHCHPKDPVPGRYTVTQQTQYRDGTLSPYRPSTGVEGGHLPTNPVWEWHTIFQQTPGSDGRTPSPDQSSMGIVHCLPIKQIGRGGGGGGGRGWGWLGHPVPTNPTLGW